MRSCEILRWRKTDVSNFCQVSSIQQTPMWCIYAVSETEQIDVFSTVLPSLVLRKMRSCEILRWRKTDVSNFCEVSSIQQTPMWCIYAVSETEQIDVFLTVLPSLVLRRMRSCKILLWKKPMFQISAKFDSTNRCDVYMRYRNRTDWCIFDRSPITSFWEKCVHVKYWFGEKPMFQISAKCASIPNRHRCDVYMRYQKPNRLMYFRPFSHH